MPKKIVENKVNKIDKEILLEEISLQEISIIEDDIPTKQDNNPKIQLEIYETDDEYTPFDTVMEY